MSEPDPSDPHLEDDSQSRRTFLRRSAAVAAGTTGAVAAGAAVSPPAAQAAVGDPLRLGKANSAGGSSTSLSSTSPGPAVVVKNTGNGAGALVTAEKTNALAAGTHAKDYVGLSVANYATSDGRGAAVAAGGGRNNGVVASTGNADKAAVVATNLNVDGKLGIGAAVVATSGGGVVPILANQLGGHGPAIIANGEPMPDGSYGESIHAIGGMFALGDVYIEGDLYVSGTLYCDDVQPYPAALRQEHAAKGQEMKEQADKHADVAAEAVRQAP